MNILFLLPRYSTEETSSTLEKELVEEFSKNSHNCTVISISERAREVIYKNNINVIKIDVGDYYAKNTSIIKKGLISLKLPNILKKEIEVLNSKVDLVVLSTPMMNNPKVMKAIKAKFGAKILLIVWDIFPQNAKDIDVIKNHILFNYFDKKYRKSLGLADYISVMSEGNERYFINNYPKEKKKLFILKNWARIKPKIDYDIATLRKKYMFDEKDFLVIFGGNMGKPQKLSNIIQLAKELENYGKIKFIFIGKGTETKDLKYLAKQLTNTFFYDYVPREEYEEFTGMCNLGIVSLDERFTVPNFPSKTTDYFKLGIPIFASLDSCSKNDYGIFLQDVAKGGLFAEAGDISNMKEVFLKLYNNNVLREALGRNARKYYEENLSVEKAYKTIMEKLGEN